MTDRPDDILPPGVRLVRRDGQEPIELTIRAEDLDQLAWRIHDLIPLIQSGRMNALIDTARGKPNSTPRG